MNFEDFIVGFLIITITAVGTLSTLRNNDLDKINKQLKKENYNLKVEIDKLKEKELELIVKYVGE